VSSAVLYLAIVALWAVVLVPMWLRRDGDPGRPAFSRLLHRRSDAPEEPGAEPGPESAESRGTQEAEPADVADHEAELQAHLPVPRRRNSRAAVIARRRRRTWGLSLLVLVSITTAVVGLAPLWVTLPPAGLLGAHLSLLRVAVGMDVARREEVALARAAERAEAIAARAAEEAEAAAHAEVIDLMARNKARDVFDQYAQEGLRAVGD
jgi:hypothetical protein